MALGALGTLGCGETARERACECAATPGTAVRMEDAATAGFFAAPFPDDARRADGRPDLAGFPNPTASPFLAKCLDILAHDARGFATTAGVFFTLDGPLDESTTIEPAASVEPGATVALWRVVPGGPAVPHPIDARFHADGGPFGATNLLSLLPLQGAPLAPGAAYAAIVRRALGDAAGNALGVPERLVRLVNGVRPAGMSPTVFAAYQEALASLADAGVPAAELAGLTVFTTDDPTASFRAAREALLAEPLPAPAAPFALREVFDDYCVYDTTLELPVLQEGTPPYQEAGGGWVFDASGAPIVQRREAARAVVTVPRSPMPPEGYPVVLLSRTGAGGDRPLVDRGRRDADGQVLEPGTGPALEFARAGFAGAMVDGPHGGPRNPNGGDEQFLMFNVTNPVALRDNVRQSALELALIARGLGAVHVDTTDCPGATAPPGDGATFDRTRLVLMGHSMGATIAPLTAAFEDSVRAVLLSGAGGSWIENVVWKLEPIPVRGFAELLLGVAGTYQLHEHDPALSLFQWAAEPADPPVYAARLVASPPGPAFPHVLMLQGIVDHYILPPIANATSLALGLDLAGPGLDADHAELSHFEPLAELLRFSGGATRALPVSGNRPAGGGGVTAVVTQHPEDGVEDGHEVVFQTDAPKRQYRCFLESFARGEPPRVPAAGAAGCD